MKAKGKTALRISWNKLDRAQGYDIFFAKCGKSKGKYKKVRTIKGNKKFTWTKKNLKPRTAYRAYVKAWVKKGGKKKYIATSPVVHAYTSNGTMIFTNVKSVTVKKTKVSLKAGKTYRIKGKLVKYNKKKKLMPAWHTKKLRYVSTNKKIATVTKSGRIKARSKGTCRIYVFAHNGVSRQIRVTVK